MRHGSSWYEMFHHLTQAPWMNTLIPQPLKILQNRLTRNYWTVQVPLHLRIQNPSMSIATNGSSLDVILLLQVTSVPFFLLPGSVLWWAVFIYSIAIWLKPFPPMLSKQRDAIPHEAHKEFVPCQTAIMIDVVEVKNTARFLRQHFRGFSSFQQPTVSTCARWNVAPTSGLIRLHWHALTSSLQNPDENAGTLTISSLIPRPQKAAIWIAGNSRPLKDSASPTCSFHFHSIKRLRLVLDSLSS